MEYNYKMLSMPFSTESIDFKLTETHIGSNAVLSPHKPPGSLTFTLSVDTIQDFQAPAPAQHFRHQPKDKPMMTKSLWHQFQQENDEDLPLTSLKLIQSIEAKNQEPSQKLPTQALSGPQKQRFLFENVQQQQDVPAFKNLRMGKVMRKVHSKLLLSGRPTANCSTNHTISENSQSPTKPLPAKLAIMNLGCDEPAGRAGTSKIVRQLSKGRKCMTLRVRVEENSPRTTPDIVNLSLLSSFVSTRSKSMISHSLLKDGLTSILQPEAQMAHRKSTTHGRPKMLSPRVGPKETRVAGLQFSLPTKVSTKDSRHRLSLQPHLELIASTVGLRGRASNTEPSAPSRPKSLDNARVWQKSRRLGRKV